MRKTLAGFLAVCLGLPASGFASTETPDDVSRSPSSVSVLPVASLRDTRLFASTDVLPSSLQQTPAQGPAAGTPGASIRRTVVYLGVGKKVRLRTVAGEELRGRIMSIDDGTFGLDTGQPRVISYADVSVVEPQRMRGWVKGAIFGGVIFAALSVIAGVLGSR